MWAKRGRINETLSDSHEVTHMVYLVISPPIFSHSVLFPHWPSLFLPLLLCLCTHADTPTPVVLPQWQQTDVWCHFRKVKTGGGDRKCTHANEYTRCHMHCTVTAAPRWVWVSLSVICKALQVNSSAHKHVYTHTDTSPVPTSEERGCVVVAGVTGSPSPQLTNRYNQLSWDTPCCCHSHYSWTNTYIKQSGGHWPLHYIDTHTRIHAHSCYIFNTHVHARTVIYT